MTGNQTRDHTIHSPAHYPLLHGGKPTSNVACKGIR